MNIEELIFSAFNNAAVNYVIIKLSVLRTDNCNVVITTLERIFKCVILVAFCG